MSTGEIIKQLRQEKEWTQDELAAALNTLNTDDAKATKGMISKWENGIVEPSLEYARLLAKIFNVSLDYLLGEKPMEDVQTALLVEKLHKDDDLKVLLYASSKLSKEDLDYIIQLAKRMDDE